MWGMEMIKMRMGMGKTSVEYMNFVTLNCVKLREVTLQWRNERRASYLRRWLCRVWAQLHTRGPWKWLLDAEKRWEEPQQFARIQQSETKMFSWISFECYIHNIEKWIFLFRKCVVLEVFCSFNIRRIRWDFPWKLFVAGSTTCTVHPLGLSIRVTVAADHGCLARSQGGSFCLVRKLPSYGVEVLLVAVSMTSGWKVSILSCGKESV